MKLFKMSLTAHYWRPNDNLTEFKMKVFTTFSDIFSMSSADVQSRASYGSKWTIFIMSYLEALQTYHSLPNLTSVRFGREWYVWDGVTCGAFPLVLFTAPSQAMPRLFAFPLPVQPRQSCAKPRSNELPLEQGQTSSIQAEAMSRWPQPTPDYPHSPPCDTQLMSVHKTRQKCISVCLALSAFVASNWICLVWRLVRVLRPCLYFQIYT